MVELPRHLRRIDDRRVLPARPERDGRDHRRHPRVQRRPRPARPRDRERQRGAILGDNISYFIGRWAGEHTVRRLFRCEKAHRSFDWAERQLELRGFYIIVVARFIPGGRTAVTFSSGYTQGMPWRRFIVADVTAGLIWGTWAAMLGYVGGKQFEEEPWKGLLLGFAIAIGVVARRGRPSPLAPARRPA